MSIRGFISACLAAISVFLSIMAVLLFADNWHDFRMSEQAGEMVRLLETTTRISEKMVQELGASSVALEGDPDGQTVLAVARTQMNAAFSALELAARDTPSREYLEAHRTLTAVRNDLTGWRSKVDAEIGAPPERAESFRKDFFAATNAMMERIGEINARTDRHLASLDAEVATPASLAVDATTLRDQVGRLSGMYVAAISSGKTISSENRHAMDVTLGRILQLRDRLTDQAGAPDSPAVLREGVAKVEAGFFTPFRPLRERVAKAGLGTGAYDLTSLEWRDQTAPMQESIMAMRDAAIAEAIRIAAANNAHAMRNLLLIGLLLAAAAVALVGAITGITRRVVLPLARLTAVIDAFAAGSRDFRVPYAGRSDEIGRMAKAIEILRKKSREADEAALREAAAARARDERRHRIETVTTGFVESIDTVVGGVATAVGGLRAATETLAATSTTTTEQSALAATAADHASANVQTVAAAAEELSNSIGEISRQVSETAAAMNRAVQEAGNTSANVRGLAEAARRIGDVVSLITDIASQTNLLALNATIEAARAGEAGKGFAVVAGEVKTLANQTAQATGDIQAQVAAIQAETDRAVNAIVGISGTIATVNQYTIGIASAVEQQGAATHEIARNVQEAAQGTAEVSASIARVLEAEQAIVDAAGQLSALADRLSGESERLRGDVGDFVAEVKRS